MQSTLSIIIPAYNVENYLSECLDSVVKQNNDRIEVVLVDDGSTDTTWDICCQYAKKYEYIKAFTKENGGLSNTRNFGIKHAQGTYVYFLDSDDYLADEAIGKLFEKIDSEDNDVIISLYSNLFDATGEISDCGYHLNEETVERLSGENLLQYLMKGRVYDWYAVLQTVKREFIIENSLYFEENVNFEDARWTPTVLYKAQNVAYLDFPIYVYRRNRKGSITATFSMKNFLSKFGVFDFIEKFSLQNHLSDITKEMMLANMSNLYVSALFDTWSLEKEDRKKYLNQLNKYKFILGKSARTYHKLLSVLCNVVGITALSYILYLRAQWVRRKV